VANAPAVASAVMSRLLFVVQRYGREVAGGAELLCREFATRLAARGHAVEVVTSCALNYVDWANHYPPGTAELDGVTVHRLPVAHQRDDRLFEALNSRVVWGQRPIPLYLEQQWMRAQGPYIPELAPWLLERAPDHDVVIFFTYLYYTTWAGLPAAAAVAPTVLHPTAHDEPPLYLDLFRTMFHHPAAFAFSTEEEAELVERRFRPGRPFEIVGVGVEAERHQGHDGAAFRETFGLGETPYLLYVGRVDPSKGSDELLTFFAAYKARQPGPLKLAIVGDPVRSLETHPDVLVTGFVDEALKESALAGCLALALPSYFESFSMILTEAWAHGKPALVQGHCDVLDGQCRRSGGGIPYRGFAEFEAAIDLLVEDEPLRARLGRAGRRYVEERYAWDAVLDRYDRLLTTARRADPARSFRESTVGSSPPTGPR
jgi:glycosyltransferase involved in cell wall biosynthesis